MEKIKYPFYYKKEKKFFVAQCLTFRNAFTQAEDFETLLLYAKEVLEMAVSCRNLKELPKPKSTFLRRRVFWVELDPSKIETKS
ncbi:MAG: hypothetical protein JXR63_00150 [Spirochaetales bacterium]|nr:hypothetical protein [Spirochaetales bacterium]